jgi:septal ring-binding cell division protein DamX
LAPSHWTLRLEVACQTDTLAKAVDLLKPQHPDLFLLPLSMKDGKTCTQVYLGDFGSEAEARQAVASLPAPFQAKDARPRPYQVSAIPDKQ